MGAGTWGEDAFGILVVGLASAMAALVLWRLPWNRWPSYASLIVVPIGFTLIVARNSLGDVDSTLYPILFVLAFTWIGVTQRQGMSVMLLPLFVAAYLSPVLGTDLSSSMSWTSVIYVGLVCVLVGETLAWVVGQLSRTRSALQEWRAEERFRALVQNAFDVIAIIDAGGVIRYVSPSVARVLGYGLSELSGSAFLELLHPEDAAVARDILSDLSARRVCPSRWSGACGIARGSGARWRWSDRTSSTIPTWTVSSSRCATSESARTSSSSSPTRPFHDALTDLANRALFRERLAHAGERNERTGKSAAVVFIDLDDFKTVNDSLGHGAG